MPQPMPVEPRRRVNSWTWLIFFGFYVPIDALKLLLLLVDLIPILGWILDAIVGLILSVFENMGYFALWGTGLYRSPKKGGLVNLVITWASISINFTPGLDDFPFTTPLLLFVIFKAKAFDKIEHLEYKIQLAAWHKRHRAEETVNVQIAQAAAQRAQAQRNQAMMISGAANDNAHLQEAANDNTRRQDLRVA